MQFYSDVEKHKMTVVNDDGLNRNLIFRDPENSNMWFGISTWSGCLCFYGDMGCFVFSRIDDMFEFFRGKDPNPYYWVQKLEATDKCDGHKRFSEQKFRDAIDEHIAQWVAENGVPQEVEESLVEQIEHDIYWELEESGKDDAFEAVRDFEFSEDKEHSGVFDFGTDFLERSFDEYTGRFLWACSAIPWAIGVYDDHSRT